VVSKSLTDRRPDQPFGLIVDIDNNLTYDHAITEGHYPHVGFKPRVDDKTGHQPGV
jgi:hypothetical protein